ncbi:MAG: helix-turn-helix domain-containing protein [Arenicella sp.]|nr:helix-turn-helix domain-containing protein [Arenicella sp.]
MQEYPPNKSLAVGDLARAGQCKVETVRYYEKIGLMPIPQRTAGGRRSYQQSELKRLIFIRRSRELGFSVAQVRNLLRFVDEPNHTCGEVKGLTLAQSKEVQSKIDDLQRLHKALLEMADKCKGQNYSLDQCPIIDALFEDNNLNALIPQK